MSDTMEPRFSLETLLRPQQRFQLPTLQKSKTRNGVEIYAFPFLDDNNQIDSELLTLLFKYRPYARHEGMTKKEGWENFHKTCQEHNAEHAIGGFKVLQGIGLGTIRQRVLRYVEVMTKIWQLEQQQQQQQQPQNGGGEIIGNATYVARCRVRRILEAVVKDIQKSDKNEKEKSNNKKKAALKSPPQAALANCRRDENHTGSDVRGKEAADDGSLSDATTISDLSALSPRKKKRRKRRRRDHDDYDDDDDPEARARREEHAMKVQEMRLLRIEKEHEVHIKELQVREKELALKEKELELDRYREANRAAQSQRNDELMMALIEKFNKRNVSNTDNDERGQI